MPVESPRPALAGPLRVTRPADSALRWTADLRARGIDARPLPLIAIEAAPDGEVLARSRAALADFDAVMFVSAPAVRGLLPAGSAWPAERTRAWATGPGTCEALRAAGVPADRIDAPEASAGRFDSEALWQRVQGQAVGARVLIVRGADGEGRPAGRDWLASRLRQAGAEVQAVAAYRRALPAWDAAQHALARSAEGAWLFSSSEAIGNLVRLCPGVDWSGARAVCTHARIAQAARAAGFGRVDTAPATIEGLSGFLQSRT